jgi:hypothetical protein
MKKFEKTVFEKEAQKYNLDIKGENDFYKLSSIFAKEFSLINSVHAAGIDFKDFLGLAVKIGVMYYTMSGYVKNYAFPQSGNRAVTWGIMAVVNAAILKFDSDKKCEAQERLKIVQNEKKEFIKSAVASGYTFDANIANGLNGGKISLADASAGSGGGRGIIGCAKPKGSSYAPAPCPTVIPKKRFNISTSGAKFIPNGSPLKNALNSLSQVAYGAATGTQYSNPSLMGANVKS